MKRKKQGGFTLVEVIVVAGIIAILAGVLVPLVLKEIDEARISRTSADARSVSMSMLVMRKDTGRWPNLDGSCNPTVSLLRGNGNLPAGLAGQGYDETTTALMDDHLANDASGCYGSRWKGPYMPLTAADPWGNAYIVNAFNFAGGGSVWILSAGPNGTIDTPVGADALGGDDVGMMISKTAIAL